MRENRRYGRAVPARDIGRMIAESGLHRANDPSPSPYHSHVHYHEPQTHKTLPREPGGSGIIRQTDPKRLDQKSSKLAIFPPHQQGWRL